MKSDIIRTIFFLLINLIIIGIIWFIMLINVFDQIGSPRLIPTKVANSITPIGIILFFVSPLITAIILHFTNRIIKTVFNKTQINPRQLLIGIAISYFCIGIYLLSLFISGYYAKQKSISTKNEIISEIIDLKKESKDSINLTINKFINNTQAEIGARVKFSLLGAGIPDGKYELSIIQNNKKILTIPSQISTLKDNRTMNFINLPNQYLYNNKNIPTEPKIEMPNTLILSYNPLNHDKRAIYIIELAKIQDFKNTQRTMLTEQDLVFWSKEIDLEEE